DERYMRRALFHAARGRGRTSPNPMVGAVILSPDGIVVGQGHTQPAGDAHAEVRALADAGARARGATMYVTLEPCAHHGRTGPCCERVVGAGIARVVAAVQDPNPLVNGRGFAYLREHGVTVDIGLGADESCALNRPFFTMMREHRPFVILKAATSLDGCIAEAPGRRTQLTSAPADRHAHAVRAEVDAIGVGINTLLVDDPLLTPRGPYRERPLVRVVFDRRLRTPPAAKVLSTRDAGPVIIVTTADVAACAELRTPLQDAGADVAVARDGTFRAALEQLARRDIGSLLLEGGAEVIASAWDEGLVDCVSLYVTPHVMGQDGVPLLPGREGVSAALADRIVQTLGPDVLIEGYVHRTR
ncbi:MAG TPA: bifunctional diaminohydroxyphosphoribosylaminopyrimidine deaminase/5-amino-6-(5-phosphoribosylamino)uracil reductase RibD, partial [Caldimonas sp.]|nr:bifunctional diaminohydroxyphosphoribosylaminopyrimidine deaminase/5-amino-6-(5-phosphoribosylamino)uracil reductase RibD [Caldimonas sp.]